MLSNDHYKPLNQTLNGIPSTLENYYGLGVMNERKAILTLVNKIIDNNEGYESWTVLLRQARDAIANHSAWGWMLSTIEYSYCRGRNDPRDTSSCGVVRNPLPLGMGRFKTHVYTKKVVSDSLWTE